MFLTHTTLPFSQERVAFRETEGVMRFEVDQALNSWQEVKQETPGHEVVIGSNLTTVHERAQKMGDLGTQVFTTKVGESPRKQRMERILVSHLKHTSIPGGHWHKEDIENGPKLSTFERKETQKALKSQPFRWLEGVNW